MILPLVDQEMTARLEEYQAILTTAEGFEFQIETDAIVSESNGNTTVLSFEGESDHSCDLDALLSGKIESAVVDTTGRLTISMASGNGITVPADPEFEAWTLVGPGGYRVVCMPGGELATWSPGHA